MALERAPTGPEAPSPASLAREVARLAAGERAWFWMRSGAGEAAVAISPVAADPGMTVLADRVRPLPVEAGATEIVGLLHTGADGVCELASPDAAAGHPAALAALVRAHAEAHPGLLRLAGARFVALDPDEVVTAVHDAPGAWAGLRAPEPPGSPDDAAATLAALPAGSGAWAWVTPAGPEGRPFLALSPQALDPDGAALADRVRRLRARCPGEPGASVGVLRRLGSGTLVLVVDTDADRAAVALAALSTRPALAALAGVAVLDKGARGFAAGARRAPPDHGATAAAVAALGAPPEGERTWFWFAGSAADGLPRLVAGRDREAVRAAGAAAAGDGASVAGQLQLGPDGVIEVHTRAPTDDLLPMLARFVWAFHAGWPALLRLRGARVHVRAEGGAIVGERRDPAAWRGVPRPAPVGGA